MKAKTIAEVVAGEMTYKGTPAAQWGDALGIASVIANRATAYGVSPQDVISAPGQFNAYGQSLPKGVGAKEIARAQKALDTVAKYGPSTSATHYARPEATKNIKGWSSFKTVDQIPGSHVFAIDPNMNPIRTAQGVVQAQPNAFETLVNTAKVGAIKTVQAVASIPQAAAAMVREGFSPDQLAQAQAATASNVAGLYPGSFQYAATVPAEERNMNPALRDALLGTSAERARSLNITSAHRTPAHNRAIGSTSASLHLTGNAVDIDMTGMSATERQSMMTDLMQRGITRFSAYSNLPNTLHADFGTPLGPNVPNFMFNKTKANLQQAPDWYRDFANSVIANQALPTPAIAPAPQRSPSGPVQGPPISAMQRPQQGPPMSAMQQADPERFASAPAAAMPGVGTTPMANAPAFGDTSTAVGGTMTPSLADAMSRSRPQQGPPMSAMPQPAGTRFGPMASVDTTPMQAAPPANLAANPIPGFGTVTPEVAAALRPQQGPPAPAPMKPQQGPPMSAMEVPSLAELPEPQAVTEKVQPPATPPQQAEVIKSPVRTVAAPTIAPAAPPPAKPGGLIGALENLAAPLSKPFHTLANIAGPTPNPPSRNIGYGTEAIGSVLGGQAQAGDTAYSKSTPGYSVKDLGNGMVQKTNQFGHISFEHVDKPGGIFSGQPTTGGLLSNFGLPGLGSAIGGLFGGTGFGNTANVGPNAFGYAGPWGAGTAPATGGGLFGGFGGGFGGFGGKSTGGRRGGASSTGGRGSMSAGSGGLSHSTRY